MSFINFPSPTPIFPVLSPLAWSVKKTPSILAKPSRAVSGREVQILRAVYPRFEFTLTYGGEAWLREQTQNITPYAPLSGDVELAKLSGLFMQCLGAKGEFYYDDPDDDSRLAQAVGVGNGIQTTFPLFFSWGTGPFSPSLTLPVLGINTIDAVYFNGVRQFSGFSLDSTNTKLVFSSPPGLVGIVGPTITADFHFYWRCRFLADLEEYEQWAKNLWENRELKFQSVKQ